MYVCTHKHTSFLHRLAERGRKGKGGERSAHGRLSPNPPGVRGCVRNNRAQIRLQAPRSEARSSLASSNGCLLLHSPVFFCLTHAINQAGGVRVEGGREGERERGKERGKKKKERKKERRESFKRESLRAPASELRGVRRREGNLSEQRRQRKSRRRGSASAYARAPQHASCGMHSKRTCVIPTLPPAHGECRKSHARARFLRRRKWACCTPGRHTCCSAVSEGLGKACWVSPMGQTWGVLRQSQRFRLVRRAAAHLCPAARVHLRHASARSSPSPRRS